EEISSRMCLGFPRQVQPQENVGHCLCPADATRDENAPHSAPAHGGESMEMLGIIDELRGRMACIMHRPLYPGGALPCASNSSSLCAAMMARKKPSPPSSPCRRTPSASSIWA